MYEELIERLKEDAEWAEANEWETPYTKKTETAKERCER